jgi:uncharacterized protein YegL/serine/threonine protein kinase
MSEEVTAGMRRFPVYLLLDCSGYMAGEPIDAVRMGLRALISDLRGDPFALETAWLSVITFDSTAKQVVPLTELALVQEPPINAGGGTSLGAALKLLADCINKEVRKGTVDKKGDFKPLVLLMTDGQSTDNWQGPIDQPTDSWQEPVDDLKKLVGAQNIIVYAAGQNADETLLKRITELVVNLNSCERGNLGDIVGRYLSFNDELWCVDSYPVTSIERAVLTDGREVEYVLDPGFLEDRVIQMFFTLDRSAAILFRRKAYSDPTMRARLEALVGKFNPTTGPHGEYWRKLFCCWPTGIVESPERGVGIMCPAIPGHFYFSEGGMKGHVKAGQWFTSRKLRSLIPKSERRRWNNYFRACIMVARSVRRLHDKGLIHSDLSPRNILFDPPSGKCILLGWNELVIPGFPAEVIGAPGYIAPELVTTYRLNIKDPTRKHPCIATDRHALAVFIYEFLLFRHPLKGPRVNFTESAEEDEFLSLGANALFIEHPIDHSNRPAKEQLGVEYEALGPHLVALFNQAFVDGLHDPMRRPSAAQWEDALLKTGDMLHPCPNHDCTHKWFVMWPEGRQSCPFCGVKLDGTMLKLIFRKEVRPGEWLPDGELTLYDGLPIFKWHIFDNVQPNETLTDADREIVADCQFYEGRWLLINRKLEEMVSPGGNRVAPNSAIELRPGSRFRFSTTPHGLIAEVEVMQNVSGR